MAVAAQVKRKNIDLPVDTLQKLSIMAISQGKSLKNYIETLLIMKADSVSVEVKENPSLSGDEWFDEPKNMAAVKRGITQHKAGEGREFSIDDIKSTLGL